MKKKQLNNSKNSEENLPEQESIPQKSSQTKPSTVEGPSIPNPSNRIGPLNFELYDVVSIPNTEAVGGPLWILDVEYGSGYGYLIIRPLNRKYELQRVSVRILSELGAEVVDHYNKTAVQVLFSGNTK